MEYRFNVGTGRYRHFIVEANSVKQARQRFDSASKLWPSPTHGFQLKDVTSIEPIDKEVKCQNNV